MHRHPICGKMDTKKQLNVPLHAMLKFRDHEAVHDKAKTQAIMRTFPHCKYTQHPPVPLVGVLSTVHKFTGYAFFPPDLLGEWNCLVTGTRASIAAQSAKFVQNKLVTMHTSGAELHFVTFNGHTGMFLFNKVLFKRDDGGYVTSKFENVPFKLIYFNSAWVGWCV